MVNHRQVVGAILLNEQGHVLLQLRDDKATIPYPNHWTFFGGAVEEGESADDAIQRELLEELEITLPLTRWKTYQCPVRTIEGEVIVTNTLYFGQMIHDIDQLNLLEGQEMRYFSPQDSAGLELAFMQSPLLAQFFAEQRL